MLKRMLAILTLTGISVFLVGAASAHDADHVERDGRSLVGSWIVRGVGDGGVVPPFTSLSTFTKDGAMISAPQNTQTGLGVWRRTGGRQFSFKFVELFALDDLSVPPDSSLTVTSEVTVSKDGASASGPFLGVIENPAIGELFRFTGTAALERITIPDDDDHDHGHGDHGD